MVQRKDKRCITEVFLVFMTITSRSNKVAEVYHGKLFAQYYYKTFNAFYSLQT